MLGGQGFFDELLDGLLGIHELEEELLEDHGFKEELLEGHEVLDVLSVVRAAGIQRSLSVRKSSSN